ncbi:unnamed protein product [Prunus armeniaca]
MYLVQTSKIVETWLTNPQAKQIKSVITRGSNRDFSPLGEYTDIETHSRALLVVIDYEAAIHLWKVDKVLLFVARPRTFVQGNLPNSMVYRNVEQYPNAKQCSWNSEILILEIDAPIYFANNNYLREKHTGWRGLDEGIVVVGTCMI